MCWHFFIISSGFKYEIYALRTIVLNFNLKTTLCFLKIALMKWMGMAHRLNTLLEYLIFVMALSPLYYNSSVGMAAYGNSHGHSSWVRIISLTPLKWTYHLNSFYQAQAYGRHTKEISNYLFSGRTTKVRVPNSPRLLVVYILSSFHSSIFFLEKK